MRALLRFKSLLWQPKKLHGIPRGHAIHFLEADTFDLGNGLGHFQNKGGFVAFAAVRNRSEVRRIRLHHELCQRTAADRLSDVSCIRIRGDPREREQVATRKERRDSIVCFRTAVEHELQRFHSINDGTKICDGFTVVNDGGKSPVARALELKTKNFLLHVSRGKIVVVIEPDLPDGADFWRSTDQRFETMLVSFLPQFRVMRMHTNRAKKLFVFFSKSQALLSFIQTIGNRNRSRNSLRIGSRQYLRQIRCKLGVREVAVGIDHRIDKINRK